MVRAKFMLVSVTSHSHDSGAGRTLKFQPQYDSTVPEDQKFALYTPTGEFTMYCDNPAALDQLKLGKQYYFDITEA